MLNYYFFSLHQLIFELSLILLSTYPNSTRKLPINRSTERNDPRSLNFLLAVLEFEFIPELSVTNNIGEIRLPLLPVELPEGNLVLASPKGLPVQQSTI